MRLRLEGRKVADRVGKEGHSDFFLYFSLKRLLVGFSLLSFAAYGIKKVFVF